MENLQRHLYGELAESASHAPLFTEERSGKRFFTDLRQLVSERPVDERLGAEIMELARQWVADNSLLHYSNTTRAAYGRTYLGRCAETGWGGDRDELAAGSPVKYPRASPLRGLLLRRRRFPDRAVRTDGPGRVRLKETVEVEAPKGFHAIGSAGHFDNHIHRITCLSGQGHSLHIYSDDALQGEIYELEEP